MKTSIATVALSVAVLLGACGSSDSDGAGAEPSVTTQIPSTSQAPATSQISLPGGPVTRLWIGPELVDCVGVAPQKCMLVAESADGEPELFYDEIEGFSFVEGTSYVIDVTIEEIADPPADGSSLRYVLSEIVESS